MDWLKNKLGFIDWEDWYRVSLADFDANFGRTLVRKHYKSSPYHLLSSVYPEYQFVPWFFNSVPADFFSSVANRKNYVEWLKAKVGASNLRELRKVDFSANHGNGLLARYHWSPEVIIDSLTESNDVGGEKVSDTTSGIERTAHTGIIRPRNYWNSIENQRAFLYELGKRMAIKDPSMWYSVQKKDIIEHGGSGLIDRYEGSLFGLLTAVYPHVQWLPWKFAHLPRGLSQDKNVLKNAISACEKELKIKSSTDWYRVSQLQLDELGVAHIFNANGGLFEVLKVHYPDHQWSKEHILSKATK